ncbi:MAG: 23S rRNA (adenine(2503)-C(2))-methyltransferase RlmN [Desulfococcus sp.]|nr:MAG: 23S rRNA (adenine(2503)-C(2))-methyltransferase RlmN [Desulfococcus sp.]
MDREKRSLLDLSPEDLQGWLSGEGEASYRAGQILKWLYQRQADDIDAFTDIAASLRRKLGEYFHVPRLETAAVDASTDGTKKYLFRLRDGRCVETVLIPEKEHYTLCVSSQVGCAQACRFCLTAGMGLVRNLDSGEILSQVRDIQRIIPADDPRRLTNLVFMGMGEPLMNYRELIRALRILLDAGNGMKFSSRKITVSTCGIVPLMRRLGNETRVNLAVSLNAPDDDLRTRLMPVNRRYPLKELMAACRDYPLQNRRRITFEYILMKDVNDGPAHARALVRLLRGIRCKINLIPFNEHPGSIFFRPDEDRISVFQELLADARYTAIVRYSKGRDISAACGQLHGGESGAGE